MFSFMQIMASIKVDIEIPLFLLFLGYTLSASVSTNLLIFRTCYVTLGYNESECAQLGMKHPSINTTELEEIVQPHANVISTTKNFIEAFLNIFLCLFVGPWSDTNGRRPVLIYSLLGQVFGCVGMIIFCVFTNASPWLSLLSGVGIFFGGFSSFITVCVCYIADVTSEETRGIRMGIFETVITLGMLIGSLLSSYVFYAVGYTLVFTICGGCLMLGFLYTLLFIPESISRSQQEVEAKNLFSTTHIKDTVKSILKKREMFDRTSVICTALLLGLAAFVWTDVSINFLYVRERFNWSLEKYTLFSSIEMCIYICGTLLTVYVLHKIVHIPETVLMLIACISLLNGSLMFALAKHDSVIYLGAVLKLFGAALSPMARSLISKIVHPSEVGKIFTLTVALETLSQTISGPLYTFVYNSTIDRMPGAYNLLSATIYLIAIVITTVIIVLRSFQRKITYGPLLQEPEETVA